ncbi:hypothetical protein GCM10009801_14220 [Streptomyces albiaxialis]|uniref:Uncharacterized protein n=1 Tax=Streptomyces albiaxialis TaxID=329523 RepID=A0ABP5H7I2_9ACTN
MPPGSELALPHLDQHAEARHVMASAATDVEATGLRRAESREGAAGGAVPYGRARGSHGDRARARWAWNRPEQTAHALLDTCRASPGEVPGCP